MHMHMHMYVHVHVHVTCTCCHMHMHMSHAHVHCICGACYLSHLLDDRQPLLVELRLELALVPEALRLVSSKQLSGPWSVVSSKELRSRVGQWLVRLFRGRRA
jgi:predicted signal transduction protein with EAL and GGDEF domain